MPKGSLLYRHPVVANVYVMECPAESTLIDARTTSVFVGVLVGNVLEILTYVLMTHVFVGVLEADVLEILTAA